MLTQQEQILEDVTRKSVQYLKQNFITFDQCIKAMELYAKQRLSELHKPEKTNDTPDFLKAVKNQRNTFCAAINRQEWNTELRTKAEDLLIMYDQMAERLQPSEVWPPKPEGTTYAAISSQPSENSGCISYLKIEQDQAIERMKVLGINTEAQTFEQMVNSAITMAEEFKNEPSEDSGQMELVQEIIKRLENITKKPVCALYPCVIQDDYNAVAQEIAALFPSSRSQEKDVKGSSTCEICVNKDFNDMGCKNYLQDFKCKNLNI